MLKQFSPQDWPGLDIEPLGLVKYASTNLHFDDRRQLAKRAGEEFAYHVSQLPPPNGEEYVHVIALGSLEAYGPNRKGDAFPEGVCKKYHNTFVKHAKWYRNHKHNDPRQSYGVVKYSQYNEKMRRIDLIVALNATKTAADKNGGLIADLELNRLLRGQSLPVSMACRVSHDICSGCGNMARTTWEYCTAKMCKYGGCATNLGKAFDDGHVLHVINPDPLFFDISYVLVPADRIAYTIGLLKPSAVKASSNVLEDIPLETFYKTFESASFPDWLLKKAIGTNSIAEKKAQILDKLVELEQSANTRSSIRLFDHDKSFLFDRVNLTPRQLLGLSIKYGCILPPSVFAAKIVPAIRPELSYIKDFLPQSCFSILKSAADLDARLSFTYYNRWENPVIDTKNLKDLQFYWSIDEPYLSKRLTELSILPYRNTIKQASYNREINKEYASYLLEVLMPRVIADTSSLTTKSASDNRLLVLITLANKNYF